MRRAIPLLPVVVALPLVGAGAFLLGGERSAGDERASAGVRPVIGAVNPDGERIKLQTDKPAEGRKEVELTVVSTKERDTLALVPVFIGGKGPFAFALDTGASRTIMDEKAARKAGLKPGKSIGRLQGVAGSANGREVSVRSWAADEIELRPAKISTLKGLARDGGPEGLLGSDVLSRYGRVAVDYDNDKLLLDPKLKSGG